MEPRRNNNFPGGNDPRQHARSTNQDDRVIKTNGKYNLDFIDWNNEWESIYSGMETFNPDEDDGTNPYPGYNIPYGVSEATFAAEIDSMHQENEDDGKKGLSEEMLNKMKPMVMKKSGKECSVCFSSFKDGEIIRRLPCKHIFHNKCVMPWFEKHITCPNCRFNVEEFFNNQP